MCVPRPRCCLPRSPTIAALLGVRLWCPLAARLQHLMADQEERLKGQFALEIETLRQELDSSKREWERREKVRATAAARSALAKTEAVDHNSFCSLCILLWHLCCRVCENLVQDREVRFRTELNEAAQEKAKLQQQLVSQVSERL
jgi:hypothetical protein